MNTNLDDRKGPKQDGWDKYGQIGLKLAIVWIVGQLMAMAALVVGLFMK